MQYITSCLHVTRRNFGSIWFGRPVICIEHRSDVRAAEILDSESSTNRIGILLFTIVRNPGTIRQKLNLEQQAPHGNQKQSKRIVWLVHT
eukprot:5999063-Amphidinium_carterae.1